MRTKAGASWIADISCRVSFFQWMLGARSVMSELRNPLCYDEIIDAGFVDIWPEDVSNRKLYGAGWSSLSLTVIGVPRSPLY